MKLTNVQISLLLSSYGHWAIAGRIMYFHCDEIADALECDALEGLGLMKSTLKDNWKWYRITKKGRKVIRRIVMIDSNRD
jgi:hypothetical protein